MFGFGKKITRWDYEPKKYGLASQNEPVEDLNISCNCRLYPDMKKAYDKFADLFNINKETTGFILANGCENVMKQVLLAMKPKNLTWFEPTWKMPEVFCAALGIKPRKYKFKYSHKDRKIYTPKLYRGGDCFYSNYGTSSLFHYYGNGEGSMIGANSRFKYTIIDVTYCDYSEMRIAKHYVEDDPDTIIIGSFDKLAGCGLRLGFAIFNKKVWNERMQLQREQYINMCAFNWLQNITKMKLLYNIPKNPVRDYLAKNLIHLPKNWSLSDNFITIAGHVKARANLNPIYFEIDGQQFTKFGLPSTKYEKQQIYKIIKKEISLWELSKGSTLLHIK